MRTAPDAVITQTGAFYRSTFFPPLPLVLESFDAKKYGLMVDKESLFDEFLISADFRQISVKLRGVVGGASSN